MKPKPVEPLKKKELDSIKDAFTRRREAMKKEEELKEKELEKVRDYFRKKNEEQSKGQKVNVKGKTLISFPASVLAENREVKKKGSYWESFKEKIMQLKKKRETKPNNQNSK